MPQPDQCEPKAGSQTSQCPRTSDCTGRAQCVPLLHQLSACHRGDRDVDQANVATLVLLPLPVCVFVEVQHDGGNRRQAAEVKPLTPEDVVHLQLAGRPSIQTVIQTQLAEVPAGQSIWL